MRNRYDSFFSEEAGGDEPWHDIAQICNNGHVVNAATKDSPELNQKFCASCGEATITKCPTCALDIRGEYHVPGIVALGSGYSAPGFCIGCGHGYPWTQARLMAARELAMELTALEPEERETLAKSLDDLVRDTPRTALAATRFKKLAAKAGSTAASGFKDILISVVTEGAKKMLWPV